MRSTWIVVVLAIAVSTANSASAQPVLLACSQSGSGADYLKLCLTRDGNIVNFESPKGKEQIGVGEVLEGTRACWWDPNAGPGGQLQIRSAVDPDPLFQDWAPPYKIQQPNGPNTFPITLFRRTLDGLLEMKQVFSRDSAERELTITQTLTNRSGKLLQYVGMERLVNLQIDGTSNDSDYVRSGRSVVVYDQPFLHGGQPSNAVSLSGITAGNILRVGRFLGSSPTEQCGEVITTSAPLKNTQKLDGTYCNGCFFVGYGLGNMPNGASRTVKFLYRAF